MSTIAITGVAGLIGRQLVRALDERPEVERIVGIDRRAPAGTTSTKLVFREADIRGDDLAAVLHDVDVVVHLAFQLDPLRDGDAMRAVNVDGTRNVLEAAVAAGVRRIVYPSSVVAYGAHPDNDVPLTEESPIRGTPQFDYAEHKRDVERWLWPWAATHDDLQLTVLRLALVLGPGVQNFVTRMLEQPRMTVIKGHRPPLQFVHLDDVVSAILHVLDHDLTGAYNVCAEGWLSFDEVTAIARKRTIELPEEVAFSTLERLWALGIGDHPAGVVHHLMHPCVMSADKLVATGWRPTATNRDAVAVTAEEHAGYVALPGVRVERAALGWGAAVVGAFAAFGIGRSVRRRWRRRRGSDAPAA